MMTLAQFERRARAGDREVLGLVSRGDRFEEVVSQLWETREARSRYPTRDALRTDLSATLNTCWRHHRASRGRSASAARREAAISRLEEHTWRDEFERTGGTVDGEYLTPAELQQEFGDVETYLAYRRSPANPRLRAQLARQAELEGRRPRRTRPTTLMTHDELIWRLEYRGAGAVLDGRQLSAAELQERFADLEAYFRYRRRNP